MRTGLVFLCLVAAACGGRRGPGGGDGGPGGGDGGVYMCSRGGPTIVCNGVTELTCNSDGSVASMRTCTAEGLVCAPGLGCRMCVPGTGSCEGNTTRTCNADGMGWTAGATCDAAAGETCNVSTGVCASLCRDAEASSSYIGCEYWPTTVMNAGLADEFEFAVVVANPQSVPADVTITRGGAAVTSATVAPGSLETITLPYVPELKGDDTHQASVLVRGGAYRLRSTVPVTVYQFNALEYRVSRDCAREADDPLNIPDGQCFSYTNDASLLLPTHVLTANYMVLSRPTMINYLTDGIDEVYLTSPGFFAVIGVDDAPTTVSVDFTAHVEASMDGMVRAFNPGDNGMFTLEQGDVLQIATTQPQTCLNPGTTEPYGLGATITYCQPGNDYDLTGTIVRAGAGQRVAVISGHNCDFVPYNRWACDHLEEAMFPLEAWGQDYIVSMTAPLRSEPNLIRIVSGHDNNMLTFDPPVQPSQTLNRGQILEFEASMDFRVTGTDAFSVVQHLVGQDYAGLGSSGMMGNGDPALGLAIPTEQFRTSYTFLAPTTYVVSYVNVTAPDGAEVILDGAPVTGWRTVGGSGFSTTRLMINGGSHEISSTSAPFGIVVYGFGSYTSYMYPGGLDFEAINIPF